jgi:GDP-4-dehydro-6-deoxy-D-mannose reductase
MRILITGAGGFVGPHLVRELASRFGRNVVIAATSRDGGWRAGIGEMLPLDICDADALDRMVRDVAPTRVVHLAAVSSPVDVAADPSVAWRVNVLGTRAVAEAIMRHAPHCPLIFAGSGLVYGACESAGRAAGETAALAPVGDYAATKAAADLALGALAAKGLKSVRLRLFNHTGPGQKQTFVVPGFAAQIARIEAGDQAPVIRVGNLDAARDFLDVRDVAAAFALCVERATKLPPGVILNIASGVPRTIRSVLEGLLALSRVPIRCEIDPARLRPSDLPVLVGDAGLARQLLGWRPRQDFADTLASVLASWRVRIAGNASKLAQTLP